jgi:hypothetical protein
MNGAKGPVRRHHLPGFTGPCFSQGDVYGRIRFDGNASRQNLLVIRSYGLEGCESMGKTKPRENPAKLLPLRNFVTQVGF